MTVPEITVALFFLKFVRYGELNVQSLILFGIFRNNSNIGIDISIPIILNTKGTDSNKSR